MSEKYKFAIFLATLAAFLGTGDGANILCIFTSNSPSHIIVHMSHARALVERGHNVTVVTTIPLKDKNPRFHHIYIPPTEARLRETAEMKSHWARPKTLSDKLLGGFKMGLSFGPPQYEAIKDQHFQDFMHNDENKFDLLVLGYVFNDFQVGLGLHFKCPIVISWLFSPVVFINRFVGNPAEVSYVQAVPLAAMPDRAKFFGRLTNFLAFLSAEIFTLFVDRQVEGLYNDLFPAPDYPSLKEARKKISLVLVNSHFSEGAIRPNVPAIIEVGGIQIKDKPDPLPKHLQEICDASSEHGVIYLSFGTNLGSKDLNPETFTIIYKALAGLKQTVLWKWDGVDKPGNSSNIHYEQWLPQDDLLAQPNLRVFITHAGKGSTVESQYHGVPMVAIPLFGDQSTNAAQIVRDGFGVSINPNTMTTETLLAAILEVLGNSKYAENVKAFSALYRDRPMTARETSVYWMEYVIRHKGAYHMQSPLVHLNGFQYISADVLGFLLVVIFFAYKLIKITTKCLLWKLSLLFGSKNQKDKTL